MQKQKYNQRRDKSPHHQKTDGAGYNPAKETSHDETHRKVGFHSYRGEYNNESQNEFTLTKSAERQCVKWKFG